MRGRFLSAILTARSDEALRILDSALNVGYDRLSVFSDVVVRALDTVGELCERSAITVADGLAATATAEYALTASRRGAARTFVWRGTMVVTSVVGELHRVGAAMVADIMEREGWHVRLLDKDVPHEAIVGSVRETAADVLAISATLPSNLPAVVALIELVRHAIGETAPEILLGGRAFADLPQFANSVGALGAYTDLRRAVAGLCP